MAAPSDGEDRVRPELAELIAARYPDRTVHVVGDAAYVGKRLADVDGRISWTSRLKVTSVLHELPPRPGARVDPAPAGPARLGTPADVAALATSGNTWRTTQVRRYGRTDTVEITELVCSGTDRFGAEPCVSFWCATTNLGPAIVTTVVMGFRWSPPISNRPRKIW